MHKSQQPVREKTSFIIGHGRRSFVTVTVTALVCFYTCPNVISFEYIIKALNFTLASPRLKEKPELVVKRGSYHRAVYVTFFEPGRKVQVKTQQVERELLCKKG